MGRSGNGSKKDIGNTGQGEGEAREQTPTGSCVCVWFLCLIRTYKTNFVCLFEVDEEDDTWHVSR
jgi:hypothetical protein